MDIFALAYADDDFDYPDHETGGPDNFSAPAVDQQALHGILAEAEAEVDATMRFFGFVPLPSEAAGHVWEYEASDTGRARYFAAHFGSLIRFIPEISMFRCWHGGWHDDVGNLRLQAWCQSLAARDLSAAKQFKAAIEAAAASMDKEEAKEALKTVDSRAQAARQLGSMATVTAMLQALKSLPGMAIPITRWDVDPLLTGTANGVLNLRTLEFSSGRPEQLCTRKLGAPWVPGAVCPRWEAFLERVIPETELREYVQCLVGYSLTGLTDDQSFYFLHGTGANGKSIFVSVLTHVFGTYAWKARRHVLEETKTGAGDPQRDLAQLPGIRFFYGEETSTDGRLREDLVKSLTAGDVLTGEAKYEMPFSFTPVAKLWVMGNHRPIVDGTDHGIWRRVKLIPFSVTIPRHEQRPMSELLAELKAEAPGILNWAIEGLKRWRPNMCPDSVKKAVDEYRTGEDDLADFIEVCTSPLEKHRLPFQQLYNAYRIWADSQGLRPWPARKFNRRYGDRPGVQKDLARREWVGVRLTTDDVAPTI